MGVQEINKIKSQFILLIPMGINLNSTQVHSKTDCPITKKINLI